MAQTKYAMQDARPMLRMFAVSALLFTVGRLLQLVDDSHDVPMKGDE